MFQDLDDAGIPAVELVQNDRRIDVDNIVVTFGVDCRLGGNKVVILSLTDRVGDNKVSPANPIRGESATDQKNTELAYIPCIAALVLGVN